MEGSIEKDIAIDEDDLVVEMCVDQGSKTGEEYIQSFATAPIRVTHLPTGIKAVGEGQGNQIKNKEKAIELLKKLLSERSL